ncbi:MAG TPA: hypothetical protein VEO36_14060 [Casimicrobiaceae bacterium]|nr:hypothetical protein [Casimicrobiaceae bacterium]
MAVPGTGAVAPATSASRGRLAIIDGQRDEYRGQLMQRFAVLGIALLALLAVIGGGVVFLIVSAPHMLADAAFSALLAGGLAKSIRRIDEGDWEGSVLRSTWKPLAIVALVTVVAGIVAQMAAPGARTLGEVLMLVR